MSDLYHTESHLGRGERQNENLTWKDILRRFADLQRQITFLAGGKEVQGILLQIETAITNAQNVTANAQTALDNVSSALQQLTTVISNANAAASRADIAADEANTMNVILNRLKVELEQLQVDLTGIVQAEAQRVTNESERGTAEQGRGTAEITRRENEAARALKEQARETAEQNRATTFNTKMLTAEEKITMMQYLIDNLRSYAYEADATYDFPNLVAWNGNTFIALQKVTGVTPSDDGINYRLVAQRGVDGTGAVSSVNGIAPNPDGNVQINFDVINNVTSDATDQGLSAAMGKFLMSLITTLQNDKADAEFVAEEVARAVAALVNEAPETLSTINALAEALGDDPNFSTTIMQMLGDKASNAQLTQTNNNLTTLQTAFNTHKDHNAWLTGTLQNGWMGAIYFTMASHDTLRIKGTLGAGAVQDGTVIATLPEGFRPTHTTTILANIAGSINLIALTLSSDGAIRVYDSFNINLINNPFTNIQFNAVVNLQQ